MHIILPQEGVMYRGIFVSRDPNIALFIGNTRRTTFGIGLVAQ